MTATMENYNKELTLEEFYKIIDAHPALVQVGVTTVAGIPGMIAYNVFSSSTKKKLWKKVYEALK